MCTRDTCKDWRQKYSHAYKRDSWKLWHSTSVGVHYNLSVCALQHQCVCMTTSVCVHDNISVCAWQHQCVYITTSVCVHYNISVCARQHQCVCICIRVSSRDTKEPHKRFLRTYFYRAHWLYAWVFLSNRVLVSTMQEKEIRRLPNLPLSFEKKSILDRFRCTRNLAIRWASLSLPPHSTYIALT